MLKLLREYLPNRPPSREEWGWWLLPVTVAVCLLAFDRYGIQIRFHQFFSDRLLGSGYSQNDVQFLSQIWISASCVILMIIVPIIYLVLFPSSHSGDTAGSQGPIRHVWGLGAGTARKHLPLYGLMMTVMLPLIWLAAGTASFNELYPFYKPQSVEFWLLFEVIYLTQFVCIEFFFRGPLLFRLESRIGSAAIGAMVVPYALIHIYKPMPEALGSIVAGLLLGYLALKARTIWLGVALHCGVALTMDVFAMIRSGRLELLLQ